MSFPPWVFYELSAGLAVTKVNQVLGIIREEIENETGKKPSCLYGLGGQKYSFVLLGGQKTQSTWRWHQLRVTKEYCVRLGENNLKTTRYWKRRARYALAPTLFLPMLLPMAQSETKWWGRGTRGQNWYSCSHVLTSVHQPRTINFQLITQQRQALARGTQGHTFLSV